MRLGIRRRVLSWFFPERCAFCGTVIAAGSECCDRCRADVRRQEPPLCTLCGRSKSVCCCGGHTQAADGLVSVFVYEGPVRGAVSRLKNGNTPEELHFLAEQVAETVRREYGERAADAVTFVPRTRKEQRRRETNASERLARETARCLGLPCESVLAKVRETRPQKELTALEHGGNLRGALDVRPEAQVAGRTFLLIDDVCTTGSTVRECALMLKIYGAERVYAAALASTVYRKGEREGEHTHGSDTAGH